MQVFLVVFLGNKRIEKGKYKQIIAKLTSFLTKKLSEYTNLLLYNTLPLTLTEVVNK